MDAIQKTMIGCSVLAAGSMGLLFIGVVVSVVFFSSTMFDTFDVGDPRIEVGEGLFEKTIFITEPRLGIVTDIVIDEVDEASQSRLFLVSKTGRTSFDSDLEVVSSTDFDGYHRHLVQVDVEGDGIPEYLDTATREKAELLDEKGKSLWTRSKFGGVNSICPCDVDGDGVLEFAVGYNGFSGVELLDHNGKRLWRKSGSNIWCVRCPDLDGDGSSEIVHSNAAGELIIRDGSGQQIDSIPYRGTYYADFSITRWPDRDGMDHMLVSDDGVFLVLDAQGTMVATLETPVFSMMGDFYTTFIRPVPDAPDYFAIISDVAHGLSEQSILTIYDEDQTLLYCEVLGDSVGSIAAMPLGEGSSEALLLGSTGKVFQYIMNPLAGQQDPSDDAAPIGPE